MTRNLRDERLVAIIDDDASVRTAICSLLRSTGFQVEVFPSARDFLASGRVLRTACLIVDVCMPDMSGFYLQHGLLARGHRVSTIFVSAHDNSDTRKKATMLGALAFLGKPFSDESLIAAVGVALERHEQL